MKRYSLLYIALILTILLWILNFVALSFYLYWTIWWFDNVAHFLGGLALGVFLLSFTRNFSRKKVILCFIYVMLIGGAWEIFEYANDITQSTEKYSLDVVHDLLSDALGAILAPLAAKRFLAT